MKQEQNPYAYGYARMPRVIRKGYQQLTNMQKLLYIYLRDLCGEDGVCYRSLRSLKDETGFSIGYLQKNIPILHNEDLIHASMRKHKGTGWEIWHISIVDIWEKNAAFIQAEKEKCSQDEQSEIESVHAMNKSVHHMNRIDESVHAMNESVHAMILNRESNRELDSTENQKREGEGAHAPTPAHLKEIVDVDEDVETMQFYQNYLRNVELAKERGDPPPPRPQHMLVDALSQKVEKRITNPQIQAVSQEMLEQAQAEQHENETQYHIANGSAIGNIVPPLHTTLPSKGASHDSPSLLPSHRPDPSRHRSVSRNRDALSASEVVETPQAPGMNHQAQSVSVAPMPAQAGRSTSPAAPASTLPAQASGHIPRRPRNPRPPAMPETPKEITLTPQEQAFWGLWCKVWFNKDIAPDLTPTAYGHVKRLAPYITTSELLNSLIDYARKDLQESRGVKRKAVQLGNLVNCYRGWKQEQAAQAPPPKKEGTDFDIYKGNGPEEREAVYQEGLRRLAEGTLIE